MTLYAYIMTNDDGGAPNPFGGVCTLAYCMEMTRGAAEKGDYVVGIGGAQFRNRGGEWHIIYAMQVSEWLSSDEYCNRFPTRAPEDEEQQVTLRYGALISKDFVYWGKNAPSLSETPLEFLKDAFSNSRRAHRHSFSPAQVQTFERWFNEQEKGKQGEPFD